jgi:hypothetical protein
MVRANVERPLPLIDPRYLVTDDVPPFFDPSWEHLGTVYQIVSLLQEARPGCPAFGPGFLRMLFKQIGSRDEREHSAIFQLVDRFCLTAHSPPLSLVFSALSNGLQIWESSPNHMFAVLAVISIVTSIVKNFPASVKQAFPLIGRCIPLITARHFLFFRNAFFGMVTAICSCNPPFAEHILTVMLRFWPHTASLKQVSFCTLIALVVPKLPLRPSAEILPKLLGTIAQCIASPSARVAEAALLLIMDRTLDGLFALNTRAVFASLYRPLRTVEKHWNAEVRKLAESANVKLAKANPKLWSEVVAEEAARTENRAFQGWVYVAFAAIKKGHRMIRIADIARSFGGEMTAAEEMAENAAVQTKVRPRQGIRPTLAPNSGRRSPAPWAKLGLV